MSVNGFTTKYSQAIFRVCAAVALCALMIAFILAFRSGLLPYSADGDAFDTVYAVEQSVVDNNG